MRLLVFIAVFVMSVGCSTHPKPSPAAEPRPVRTAEEARYVATIFMIGHYGACGSSATEITDGGEYWSAQTVTGMASSHGPELHIDKPTGKITVVREMDK